MNQLREQTPCDPFELAPAREGDKRLSVGDLLVAVRSRRRVEKRQPGDAVRGLPGDFQGHIAAHRQSGKRKAFGSLGQHPLGHGPELVVAAEIGDGRLGDIGEAFDLILPERRVAKEPRKQHQREFA